MDGEVVTWLVPCLGTVERVSRISICSGGPVEGGALVRRTGERWDLTQGDVARKGASDVRRDKRKM